MWTCEELHVPIAAELPYFQKQCGLLAVVLVTLRVTGNVMWSLLLLRSFRMVLAHQTS